VHVLEIEETRLWLSRWKEHVHRWAKTVAGCGWLYSGSIRRRTEYVTLQWGCVLLSYAEIVL